MTTTRPTASPRSLLLRITLAVAGALVVWLGTTRLTGAIWGEEMTLPRHAANATGVALLAVPMVAVLRRALDRRTLSSLGLTGGRRAVRDFLLGALVWLAPAALGLTVALLAGWVEIEVGSSFLEVAGAASLLIVLVFLYEALPEELLFRGYIYRNLSAALAPWVAAVLQGFLFAFFGTVLWVVSAGWSVLGERLIMFFAIGAVLGFVRLISGSLWAVIGLHVAFQVVMQLLLSAHYVDIEVSDEGVFTAATSIVAFCAAITVAGRLWRGEPNWSNPEPEGAWRGSQSGGPAARGAA